jgi:hypothetical protein
MPPQHLARPGLGNHNVLPLYRPNHSNQAHSICAQVKGAIATPEGVEAMADVGLCAARLGNNVVALEALDLVSKAKTQVPRPSTTFIARL